MAVLRYYFVGKTLPSWDLKMQVFCELARYYGKILFPESSDDNIYNIDFEIIQKKFQNTPIPPTVLSKKVGIYSLCHIPVSDIVLDSDAFQGLGIAEEQFRNLIHADKDALANGIPRLLPYEIIASWEACKKWGILQDTSDMALKPQPLSDNEFVALCLHGGSYAMGNPASHRELLGRFSKETKLRCFVVDYRLAPLYPFPAQLHDALISFYYLISLGFPPEKIIVVGDSAGGHLSISLVLLLKHLARDTPQLPGGLVLLSPMPATDLHGESLIKNANYDYVCPTPLEWPTSPIRLFYKPGTKCTSEYKKEIKHPLLTFANGNLSGFPPTIVQSGSREILIDDIRILCNKLKEHNNPKTIIYKEYPDMVHVFHRFFHRPESDNAFKALSDFVNMLH
ncbi:alpha/beta-hydrolase [Coemansia reversa NRRL 1564]|uniref:Alpha/beta-hydrolase n=1 Tax=Coemansia reversa (strain ATCC 12441 / NRRL 1564) TaxID=763665 RepID=A0A2G5B6B6_COERN|nr:alpha/beta-hydrolase [Coemansia reversa NRRL 1564]|eukprot:PIA14549.1 alpha/beta-hydrolase [Coemansia reversa NRRL 1564]